MNIIQHYKKFFNLGDKAIDENDQLHIDWGEALIEDYKTERSKIEPAPQSFLPYEEEVRNEVIEKWMDFEIIRPKSRKDGFTKKDFIFHIFNNGFRSAISFMVQHRKRNDKEFAEAIKITPQEIQEIIDEAIKKHSNKKQICKIQDHEGEWYWIPKEV
ncbi:hypothetical protein WAF17_16570 [Bernardetia sp. ABR2-2B]|uniref:hypothetical protein n=1 Tax=Bernardetia sp. ABR2-2B TaxID=3127472 RepID=UPI0030CA7AD6